MLFSRSWMAKLQGELQTNMSYIIVSVFRGQSSRLYRELFMQYMISSKDKPVSHPLDAVHSDLDSFVLFNSGCPNDEENVQM